MTWEKFKALLFCKLGFHLWNSETYTQKMIDDCCPPHEIAFLFKTCDVCYKVKRQKLY